MATTSNQRREHAVVIGTGFSGLAAAGTLASRFERVTLLDRDEISPEIGPRRGAPQGSHPHLILERGALGLEKLFPGLRETLKDEGVPVRDYGEAVRVLFPGGWSPKSKTGVTFQVCTRALLEGHVRRRVLALPNVVAKGGFRVDGLLSSTSDGQPTVEGVQGGHDGETEEIRADLIVDASGRGSRLPQWLEDIGLPPTPERTVNAKVTYTTRVYHGEPETPVRAALMYAPTRSRGGACLGVENGMSMVTMFGVAGDSCPTDDDGFLAYAESLPNQVFADFVKKHRPAGSAYRFADLGNRWRLLHRQRNWPAGLAALGDTVCFFNPVYGQGVTTGVLQAIELGKTLDEGQDTHAFQRRAARIIRVPWAMATSADLAWDTDHVPWRARVAHWYLGRLLTLLPGNNRLYRRFILVQHMHSNPFRLLTPTAIVKPQSEPAST